jgi:hypothetical protein
MAEKKGRLGDFMMNFAAPALAAVGATYGPRYAAASAIGMHAVNNIQENKRRRTIGKELVRLADIEADADLKDRKQMHARLQEAATKVAPSETGFADVEAGSYFGVDHPLSTAGVKEEKTEKFLRKMPEPVRDMAYAEAGALAESGDIESAKDILKNRRAVQGEVLDRYMNRLYDIEDQEVQLKAQNRRDNHALRLQDVRLKAAAEQTAANQKALAEQHRLDRVHDDKRYAAELKYNTNRDAARAAREERELMYKDMTVLHDHMSDLETALIRDGVTPEDEQWEATIGPVRAQYHAARAAYLGADYTFGGADDPTVAMPPSSPEDQATALFIEQMGRPPNVEDDTEVRLYNAYLRKVNGTSPSADVPVAGTPPVSTDPGEPVPQPAPVVDPTQPPARLNDIVGPQLPDEVQQGLGTLDAIMSEVGDINEIYALMSNQGYSSEDVLALMQVRRSLQGAAPPRPTPGQRLTELFGGGDGDWSAPASARHRRR